MSEDVLPSRPPRPRSALDHIEARYGDRPWLVVGLFVLVMGGVGFLIGADSYGSGTLLAGEVLGIGGAVVGGLAGVLRVRRGGETQASRTYRAPTGWRWLLHLVLDCKNPTPRPVAAGTLRAKWVASARGSVRLALYGVVTMACAVAAADWVADWLGMGLALAGGWMLSGAKFRYD